jgi:hypothetical protein
MRKAWIILAVLVVFALGNTVSAFGPITFPYSGTLTVTYVRSVTAGYNNEFGIEKPGHISLGFTKSPYTVPGTSYATVGRCSPDVPVVLYIKSPPQGGSKTYYSDQDGSDGVNHAQVTAEAGGSYTVAFEDLTGGGDKDYNDVIMSVACARDVTAVPEFPAIALPVGLIVGILGAVFYIRSSREH